MERLHRPVMTSEVIEYINLIKFGTYADLTFGEGGHSELFLKSPIKSLYATDRDPEAIRRAQALSKWSNEPRLHLFHSEFSDFDKLVPGTQFDGILMDLGVSTTQLLEASRGFSLSKSGPLDMRMNQEGPDSLQDILGTIEADDLANALVRYTDLPKARSISKRVLSAFEAGRIKTTLDLANLMGTPRPGRSHPATALFLGLRMLVNKEMEQVEITIPQLIKMLNPGGRLVVLTFHSTEDRCIKRLFKKLAGFCICEQDLCQCPRKEYVKLLTPRPVVPSNAEIADNPRSRSTKLRAIEKL